MYSHQLSAKFWTAAFAISALGGAVATALALLGAPLGAIVLTEVSGFACLVAFTLLIWAAIQDGKPREQTAAEHSLTSA